MILNDLMGEKWIEWTRPKLEARKAISFGWVVGNMGPFDRRSSPLLHQLYWTACISGRAAAAQGFSYILRIHTDLARHFSNKNWSLWTLITLTLAYICKLRAWLRCFDWPSISNGGCAEAFLAPATSANHVHVFVLPYGVIKSDDTPPSVALTGISLHSRRGANQSYLVLTGIT